MKNTKVLMKRKNLENIPKIKFPIGFHLESFRIGDETEWARIETAAGEFTTEEKALERFKNEFFSFIEEFTERSFFLVTEEEKKIGTITAWYGKYNEHEETIGRIHWVSILPEYQGLGLAKPMLAEALQKLAELHDSAYLTTQTDSYQAVNLYLQFGFLPVITEKKEIEPWRYLGNKLNKVLLSKVIVEE